MKVNSVLCWRAPVFIALCLVASGCAPKIIHNPLTKGEYASLDFADAGSVDRWWGDTKPPFIEDSLRLQGEILKERFPTSGDTDSENDPFYNMLTISGGGADGAFGAGLLVGWSKSGKRPEFEVVSGTSAGAIIAPFAFLGTKHDKVLREIYSQLTRDKVYQPHILSGIFGGSSLADTISLQKQIKKYITVELVQEIAEQHKQARNLYIVTTDFDAMRPMIWDIGAIAEQGDYDAVQHIRKIILASASVPILFPPVIFDRQIGGKKFTELHLDGGVTRNAFAYPAQISVKEIEHIQGLTFKRNIYVIQNGNNKVLYDPAPIDLIGIATRTTLGLLQDKIKGLSQMTSPFHL